MEQQTIIFIMQRDQSAACDRRAQVPMLVQEVRSGDTARSRQYWRITFLDDEDIVYRVSCLLIG